MPIRKSIYVAGFAGSAVLIAAIVSIVTLQMREVEPKGIESTAPNTGTEVSSPAPVLNTQQQPGGRTTGNFDYARYEATELDEVIEQARPQTGVNIYPGLPLKIATTLVSYGEPCNADFLKRAMMMGGAPKEFVESVPITRCIQVRSAKGKILPLYIQDRVADFLPKEVPLGGVATLFAIHVFTGPDGPSLLVNEFSAGNAGPAGRQGSLSGRRT
jgi:hypothetical protein